MGKKTYYQSIINTLQSVERPGNYVSGGIISMPLPALSIHDSVLGLPLCDCRIKTIIEKASRAPFGRGEETIVDTSVRCTWQLSPSQFTINNPNWKKSMRILLARLKTELGCDEKMTITCELYKLLLYEPGGFFKRHRDTEKVANMFGTLVIQLPSEYEGGQLNVYHKGKETEFNFGGSDAHGNIYYTAFYADCEHEIQPITKGHRLCLVYNLLCSSDVDECPVAPSNTGHVSTIVSAMRTWNEDIAAKNCPKMMSYMLEHQYCEASLSFRSLKNTDRAVAHVLLQAKAEVDFNVFVGNVHLTEYWEASHCGYDDYSADELYNEELCAKNLRSNDGKEISSVDLPKKYLVPEDFFSGVDPDDEKFQEATGNEGATLDKQYRWAALLLWPVKKKRTGMSNQSTSEPPAKKPKVISGTSSKDASLT